MEEPCKRRKPKVPGLPTHTYTDNTLDPWCIGGALAHACGPNDRLERCLVSCLMLLCRRAQKQPRRMSRPTAR